MIYTNNYVLILFCPIQTIETGSFDWYKTLKELSVKETIHIKFNCPIEKNVENGLIETVTFWINVI